MNEGMVKRELRMIISLSFTLVLFLRAFSIFTHQLFPFPRFLYLRPFIFIPYYLIPIFSLPSYISNSKSYLKVHLNFNQISISIAFFAPLPPPLSLSHDAPQIDPETNSSLPKPFT